MSMSYVRTKVLGRKRARIIVIGLLLVLLTALSFIVSNAMGPRESRVFELIYGMSDSLYVFALLVTQFGSAWVLLGLVGLLFVVRWHPKLAVLLVRNGVITYVVVQILKLVIARPRPAGLLEDFATRELFVYGHGFPSGHAAVATMAGLTILPYLPKKWRWVPLVIIILVGWSRVYLGVHSPLDVVGGFVLGTIVVLAASYLPDFIPKRQRKN